MNFEVIWSQSAEHRLADIVEFYKKHFSETAAFELARKLILSSIHLKHAPYGGQREPLLNKRSLEYRYVVMGDFKLLYTVNEEMNQVRIADIFDCRQDPALLQKML